LRVRAPSSPLNFEVRAPLVLDSRTRIVTDEDKFLHQIVTDEDKFLHQIFAVDCDCDLLELSNDAAKKSPPPG
jgi:hypothetical protein